MITRQSIQRRVDEFLIRQHSHSVVAWLFLRGLGFIYLAAFASASLQIEGLIGANGILPIAPKLAELSRFYGAEKVLAFPTVFWLDASDRTLLWACYGGILASLLLVANALRRLALIVCYLLYLSLTVAGQDFFSFQWDVFLLETGFAAIFLTWGSWFNVFVYRWLIARFMFMGGLVKVASGDPAWTQLTALDFHYLTEPLPTPLAYYAYWLPPWFQKLCVAGVLFIELIVPFFVFMPRRFRLFAAWSFIVLEGVIVLTGNYNFFNLLTILICLWLFNDRDFAGMLPKALMTRIRAVQVWPGRIADGIAASWALIVVLVCAVTAWTHNTQDLTPKPLRALVGLAANFSVINQYGPFGVMTKTRDEIIIEGSDDGQNWREYQFNFKPGALSRSLSWNIPHQPRLDWQLWFAALERPRLDGWFAAFMARLQEGSPPVLALLRDNPFPEHPPVFLRALLYRYNYTTFDERERSGNIWRRERVGQYWPPDERLE